ncbi:hypothetical protein GJ744_003089 [Endocarpon pusillum]|uniref:Uncharacterized protein n=1 Tax=Endocarpon pusillum TaxID=364733 RepID=A0A8H7E9M2_9EURO|nr:hypothetical protein GJ744_003089 [Endocarpon pusillum]
MATNGLPSSMVSSQSPPNRSQGRTALLTRRILWSRPSHRPRFTPNKLAKMVCADINPSPPQNTPHPVQKPSQQPTCKPGP